MTRQAPPEIVEFDANHPVALVRTIEGLIDQRAGWVNFQAVVDDQGLDAPPVRAGVFAWFSSKGPSAPICTWVPGRIERKGGIAADQIGIQHPAGPRALVTLREAGLPVPEHWKRMADHPKRGLVLASTGTTSAADAKPMVEWIIRAARLLADHPLPDRWGAVVHRG